MSLLDTSLTELQHESIHPVRWTWQCGEAAQAHSWRAGYLLLKGGELGNLITITRKINRTFLNSLFIFSVSTGMLYPIILFAFTFFYLFALALFYWMHSDIELLIKRDNIWEQHLFLHLIDKKKSYGWSRLKRSIDSRDHLQVLYWVRKNERFHTEKRICICVWVSVYSHILLKFEILIICSLFTSFLVMTFCSSSLNQGPEMTSTKLWSRPEQTIIVKGYPTVGHVL